MTSGDDATLLRRYADDQAEDAFAELVRRHINLVHSAALRQVGGNEASAADVTQAVFTELARQAGRLTRHPALSGWLYTTTHRMAAHAVRGEARRQRREQEAHAMQELLHESVGPDLDWARLRPVLDAAMHDLGETDRLAVLLRHFEQRPLAEVGARLGLGENAARMRVDRALDKLRVRLAKHGVTSTAAALAVALTGQAVATAPATLVATVSTTALAATVSTSSVYGLIALMTSTKLKAVAAALLVAATGTTIVLQQLSARRLRAENIDLRQRADQLAEDARAARLAASQSAEALVRSQQPSDELLRLRGEVGQLRRQIAAAHRAVPATAAKAGDSQDARAREEAADEAVREFGIRRMTEAKQLVMGLVLFASDHDGRLPDSLEAAADHLNSGVTSPQSEPALKSIRTDDFEQVFTGSLTSIGNPSSAIVLREREAWRGINGRWARTYGFADGHSEVHASDDGDYSAWETEHRAQTVTGAAAEK